VRATPQPRSCISCPVEAEVSFCIAPSHLTPFVNHLVWDNAQRSNQTRIDCVQLEHRFYFLTHTRVRLPSALDTQEDWCKGVTRGWNFLWLNDSVLQTLLCASLHNEIMRNTARAYSVHGMQSPILRLQWKYHGWVGMTVHYTPPFCLFPIEPLWPMSTSWNLLLLAKASTAELRVNWTVRRRLEGNTGKWAGRDVVGPWHFSPRLQYNVDFFRNNEITTIFTGSDLGKKSFVISPCYDAHPKPTFLGNETA
jgi:hypothetical protein